MCSERTSQALTQSTAQSRRHIRRRQVPVVLPPGLMDLNPVLARVLAARGVVDKGMVDFSLKRLLPPRLKGLDCAARLLAKAVMQGRRITIIGDFDADGATSTALAVEALNMMGASGVDYLVPNRFEYGYGLTPEIVAVAASQGAQLLVTVDNGISSVAGVEAALKAGMQVVITDHHLPGEQLPAADAIVNPNQSGCDFPSKSLAGVGVIFYVMTALRAELDASGWFDAIKRPRPSLGGLLDLVALGTIADLVPLDQNNRVLVQQGVARMRAGRVRPGIAALLEVAKRDCQRLQSTDLAFSLAPRLNAAGRLDDMTHGIACLLTQDMVQARQYAAELDALNQERKRIEAGMQREAMAVLAHLSFSQSQLPSGLCLFDPGWHQGVIGILAARVKERYHRPTVVFAKADETTLKGSARSIPGVHLRDVLAEIDTLKPGLIIKFGGHAMAAGLSLACSNLSAFASIFEKTLSRHLSQITLVDELLSDGPLDAAQLTLPLAVELANSMPWGQHFEAPQFDNVFRIMSHRVIGEKHLKLDLQMPGSLQKFEAIAFNAREQWPMGTDTVRAVYQLMENQYAGRTTLQLNIMHAEPAANVVAPARPAEITPELIPF